MSKPGWFQAGEFGLTRIALRALGLLIVIPFLTIVYVFRDNIQGKGPILVFLLLLAILGFYLLWVIIRSVDLIQKGLVKLSKGESESLDIPESPSQLHEMTEIVNALNTLSQEFRENADQLKAFIQQFATLAEISEITAKIPDIQSLLNMVLTKAVVTTHAKRGTVMLVEESGESLEVVASQGWSFDERIPSMRIDDSIAGRVITSGNPLLIENIENCVEFSQRNKAEKYNSPSFLIMPLKTKQGPIGVLCLSEKSTGGPFNHYDQQFLAVLLGQVGYAVENARLFREARESAEQLEKMVKRQRREIQDAHRQILQAEKLSALGQLAGGVAHDFNNILQAILGYAAMAQKTIPADGKAYQNISQILSASDKAASLAGQLLAFGRRQIMKPVDSDLNRVIDDFMKMLQRLLGENIELKLDLEESLGAVHVDPRQIEQVIMNLCINARDAMKDEGSIVLETCSVTLDRNFCIRWPWAGPGSYVRITVSDKGCGIPPEVQNKIFEPFFTTKTSGKGTGLGLSTAYGIVRQHKGMIDLESEPGRGTKFHIFFPVVNRKAKEPDCPEESCDVGGSETLLIAEDDPLVRDWCRQILQENGYKVLAAADGEEAIRLFESNVDRIDLVLLDAVMPKLNGLEACNRIRGIRSDTSILFSSGYSAEIIPESFLETAGLQLLLKPYKAGDLLNQVRKTLDSRRPVSAVIPSAI